MSRFRDASFDSDHLRNFESLRAAYVAERLEEVADRSWSLRIFCGSWNVNGKNVPASTEDQRRLSWWLRTSSNVNKGEPLPQIYAIGAQEMVDLTAVNVALTDGKSSKRASDWKDMLDLAMKDLGNYECVAQRHLVGVFLCVYAQQGLAVEEVSTAIATCGLGGFLGNKGGVSVRMRLRDTTIAFVCAHMAAHRGNVDGRNADFQTIMAKTTFSLGSSSSEENLTLKRFEPSLKNLLLRQPPNFLPKTIAPPSKKDFTLAANEDDTFELDLAAPNAWTDDDDDDDVIVPEDCPTTIDGDLKKSLFLKVEDHDIIFWIGDLNYRIQKSIDAGFCFEVAEKLDFAFLLDHDQLNVERKSGRVFGGFQEGKIAFPPTYKYVPGTNALNDKKQKRPPAWCDRVLWKDDFFLYQKRKKLVSLDEYESSMHSLLSDHKPVRAVYDVTVPAVDRRKRTQCLKETVSLFENSVSQEENGLTLSATHVDLGEVKFGEMSREKTITVTSANGPAFFKIKAQRKPWLQVTPEWGVVLPKKPLVLTIKAHVQIESAKRLNAKADSLSTKIILYEYDASADEKSYEKIFETNPRAAATVFLDNKTLRVKDHAIAIEGRWKTSCWGATLEDLCFKKAVPRELWLLLDGLFEHRAAPGLFFPALLKKDDPFFAGYSSLVDSFAEFHPSLLRALESNDICLHATYGPEALAAGLVAFLSGLATPVLPPRLLPSQDIDDLPLYARDFLQRLPPQNYNTFLYVTSFCRQLLKDKHTNYLSPTKLSATLANACLPPDYPIDHPQRAFILPLFNYLLTTPSL